MQLEVKGLKYWKDDFLLLSLPWETFVVSGHREEADSSGFEPGEEGARKPGKHLEETRGTSNALPAFSSGPMLNAGLQWSRRLKCKWRVSEEWRGDFSSLRKKDEISALKRRRHKESTGLPVQHPRRTERTRDKWNVTGLQLSLYSEQPMTGLRPPL